MNKIVEQDSKKIVEAIEDNLWKNFADSKLLLTGATGFLGYNFLHLFTYLNNVLLDGSLSVYCLDNFIRGKPGWISEFEDRSYFEFINADVAVYDFDRIEPVEFIIHAASIGSPIYYRQYPIKTMEANVKGLWNLLDHFNDDKAKKSRIKQILFFSSSEIYGNPPSDQIPTSETYDGSVSCTGSRACYDESKRFGETLSVNYAKKHRLPVKIVRPFNNYGPGLSLSDGRVISDFASNILNEEDIEILSDGSPTRTFCYVADALKGFIRVLLEAPDGEPYNIGNDNPEISINDLAELMLEIAEQLFDIEEISVDFGSPDEEEYLDDNPQRRCPDISKSRNDLNYEPSISLEKGLARSLRWYRNKR